MLEKDFPEGRLVPDALFSMDPMRMKGVGFPGAGAQHHQCLACQAPRARETLEKECGAAFCLANLCSFHVWPQRPRLPVAAVGDLERGNRVLLMGLQLHWSHGYQVAASSNWFV